MSVETIMSEAAPPPGGYYAHAVARGAVVMTAGQVGLDPVTGRVPEGVGDQTKQALANIAAVLAEAGLGLEDVLKTTCFLADLDDFPVFDAAYREVFGEHRPARSTVGVRLAPAYGVEIEAVAVRPE
ncbi:RidA family protein [Agromyces silvae]|uniref:RidA family protein n=1 Tax=Agromyces silvae TaxID=3388266 RepID=UPI00280BB123|nr:RidA family protein [Agromyces protaetiae]